MYFKALGLSAPSSTGTYKFSVDEFKGLDKASGEDNFSPTRAVEMQNFIRDRVGQVKKRGAFRPSANYSGEVVWAEQWHGYTIICTPKNINVKKDGDTNYSDIITNIVGTVCHFILNDDLYLLYSVVEDGIKVSYITQFRGEDDTGEKAIADMIWSAPLTVRGLATAEGMATGETNNTKQLNITTPVIVEGASPAGGGSLIHSPNLLSPLVTETFTVTKNDLVEKVCKRFQLSMQNISLLHEESVIKSNVWMGNKDNKYWTEVGGIRELTQYGAKALQSSIKIEVYTAVGGADQLDYEWKTVDLSKVFTPGSKNFVNTKSAALWIPDAAIGASPVEGEPNVRITYIRNFSEYWKDLLMLRSFEQATCYGVGGYKDRAFLAGGNKIYYSGMDDPLYFGELCYVEPCSAGKKIVAMGGAGQVLYAVDSDGITHVISGTTAEDNANSFLMDAVFVIADRVQGEKPIGSVLKIFGGEFCYLSEEGVVAIRHDNFYDKRYAQNRSRMLGDSLKASGEKIVGGTVWGNFLVIATETQLYLLDELQQTRLEDYKYSGVQYEVFPFTFDMEKLQFTIQQVWADEQLHLSVLYCGSEYRVLVYNPDKSYDSADSEEAEIVAQWVTPPLDLSDVHRGKLIQELWLAVGKEKDAVTVEYRTDHEKNWRMLRKADGRFVPFNYGTLDYGSFNYNPKVSKLQLKVRGRPARPFYKIQFRFTSKGTRDLSLSSFGFYYKKEVI